jgi:hypothetical protein
MPEHRDLTGASLHETKGADTASADTVHVADGAGGTDWVKLTADHIDTASIFNTNKYQLVCELADVSTADFVLVPIVKASTLTKVTTILHTAITGADAGLTVTNSNGPTSIGTITVTQSGSAEGDIDTLTPASNNTFIAGSYVKIATDGASSTASKLTIVLELTQTA